MRRESNHPHRSRGIRHLFVGANALNALTSAPGRTRTDTWRILSPLPLPIGLRGLSSRRSSETTLVASEDRQGDPVEDVVFADDQFGDACAPGQFHSEDVGHDGAATDDVDPTRVDDGDLGALVMRHVQQ